MFRFSSLFASLYRPTLNPAPGLTSNSLSLLFAAVIGFTGWMLGDAMATQGLTRYVSTHPLLIPAPDMNPELEALTPI